MRSFLYGKQKYLKAAETIEKTGKSGIIISDAQFGKKVGKHAKDYGLDASNPSDRDKMQNMIVDIFYSHEEIAKGSWLGQPDDVLFYIKGDDVVVTKQSGEFITILKGGVTNARVKNARSGKI